MNKFWFVQVSTSDRWAVADPVVWSLENARQPLLEAARERLLTLDAHSDPERIVNVVLRRCGLNLVEIESPERVVVHYWTEMADLRLLFKEQQLARPEVQVRMCGTTAPSSSNLAMTSSSVNDCSGTGRGSSTCPSGNTEARRKLMTGRWHPTPGRVSVGKASSQTASPGQP